MEKVTRRLDPDDLCLRVTVSWRTEVRFRLRGNAARLEKKVRETPIKRLSEVFTGTEWEFLQAPVYLFEKEGGNGDDEGHAPD